MIDSTTELPAIAEIVRIPSPAPQPQSLAHDGEHLWLGSWDTSRVFGMDPKSGTVFESADAPGRPVGATTLGDELRFVCSENGDGDNRFIRRYVPGHGFKTHDAVACPDDTGSFLAYDGKRLWLSQRHNKRILELDAAGNAVRTIDVGEQIMGMCAVAGRLYLALWFGRDRGGSRIGYVEPDAATPRTRVVAASPFASVALAYDGARLWTNDFKALAIVAFAMPESRGE